MSTIDKLVAAFTIIAIVAALGACFHHADSYLSGTGLRVNLYGLLAISICIIATFMLSEYFIYGIVTTVLLWLVAGASHANICEEHENELQERDTRVRSYMP